MVVGGFEVYMYPAGYTLYTPRLTWYRESTGRSKVHLPSSRVYWWWCIKGCIWGVSLCILGVSGVYPGCIRGVPSVSGVYPRYIQCTSGVGVFKASYGPYWRAILNYCSTLDTWPNPRYWRYIDIYISHSSVLNCGPRGLKCGLRQIQAILGKSSLLKDPPGCW